MVGVNKGLLAAAAGGIIHARASAKLVKTASRYLADINICYEDNTVNAKSIMDIMLLGAAKGAELNKWFRNHGLPVQYLL